MVYPPFPQDPFNLNLLQDVFPSDWKNPQAADLYDLVVLGGGPAGMTAATIASHLKLKVALVEKEHLGGECLNVGCIPSKALLRCSRLAAEMKEAKTFGMQIPSGSKVDFPQVMQRVRQMRNTLSPHDSALHFQKLGIDIFLGAGRFISPDQLQVSNQILRFKKAMICTGTQPIPISIPGLQEAGFLTNQSVFNLTALPARLSVIGAGPIGCELAQAFVRFGSKVNMITRGKNLLPKDDPLATTKLQEVLKREGISLHLQTQVQKVEKKGKEKVIYLGEQQLIVDEILVAIGRAPVVTGLGLEEAKVHYDVQKGIENNDSFQTSNPQIYTAGDVGSLYKFTHLSKETARMAVFNAFKGASFKRSSLIVPWCTYTDPEIAHVGLSEKEAEERGILYQTATVELKDMDRAILDGETEGFVKLLVKKGTHQLLGATLMARHAGEMISEITVAMQSEKGILALSQAIHPFPTQAEVVRVAAEMLREHL